MSAFKEAAVSFLRMASSGQARQAFDLYVGPDFRHHNPHFPGDRQSLLDAMEKNANPEREFEVKFTVAEGNRVAVVSHVKQKPDERGAAVVHVFHFEAGKIVELWDIGQEIPETPLNKNGMF